MTEPGVASSDATNMEATAVVDGDEVVINGRKWWSSGVGHPDCKVLVFMGLRGPAGADADADRTFLRDLLGRPSVDAGGGWTILQLPPGELRADQDERVTDLPLA